MQDLWYLFSIWPLIGFWSCLSCHQLFELPFLYLNNELDLFVHVNVWFICVGIALPKPGCLPMLDIIHLCAIEIMLFLQSVFFPRQYAPFLLLMITCLFLYSTPHSYFYTQCNLPIVTTSELWHSRLVPIFLLFNISIRNLSIAVKPEVKPLFTDIYFRSRVMWQLGACTLYFFVFSLELLHFYKDGWLKDSTCCSFILFSMVLCLECH